MDNLKFIAAFYIVYFLLLIILGMFINIKVGTGYRIKILLFACAIGVYAYSLEPRIQLDLYRLQKYALGLIFDSENIIQGILGIEGYLGGMSFKGMFSFNLLCYVVRLLGDIRWLSTLSVLLTVGIIGTIIVDYIISEKYSSKTLGWSLLLSFMGIQLQYVFSGVRNAIAVAYVALAIYLWLYKNKGVSISIILFIFAITMHPMVLVIIFPILICRRPRQIVWRIFSLLSLRIIFLIPVFLQEIPINIFQYIVERIRFYENIAYQYDRPEMIANILVFLSIGFSYWYCTKRGIISGFSGNALYYVNAYYILGFVMLGCILHRDFALRIGYLMGIGAMPIICKLLDIKNHKDKAGIMIQILLRLTLTVCVIKVYYDTAVVLSQLSFG